MASPILAGDIVTFTPALVNASIFSDAPPFPPEMMAPAWPVLSEQYKTQGQSDLSVYSKFNRLTL